MSTVLSKKQMTEEDIKLQYITPAITSKWDVKKITMETQVTDGKIKVITTTSSGGLNWP